MDTKHVSCFVSMNVSAEQNILTLSKASCCVGRLFIVFFMCSNCSTALTECIQMFSIAETLCGNIAEGINVLELVFKTCNLLIIFESTNCAAARVGPKVELLGAQSVVEVKHVSSEILQQQRFLSIVAHDDVLRMQKDQNLIIQRSQKVQIQLWERQRWQLQTISIAAIEILGFPWNFCLNPPAGTCDF